MRQGGGKSKGSAFERQICTALSLWITNGRKDDTLWRSAMSGGRATVRFAKGKVSSHVSGDICAVHPDGNAFIDKYFSECKSYKDLQITGFALEQTGLLVEFWKETVKQAERHNKFPLLIFKMARRPICAALSTFGADHLGLERERCLLWVPKLDMSILHFDELTNIQYPGS